MATKPVEILPPEELPETTNDNITDVPKYHKGISVEEMMCLKLKGYSYAKVAKYLNCSESLVKQQLKPFKDEIAGNKAYSDNKGQVLSIHQQRLLKHMTNDKLKDASAYQLTGMFNIFHQAERLETNQSTSNTSVLSHVVQGLHEKL